MYVGTARALGIHPAQNRLFPRLGGLEGSDLHRQTAHLYGGGARRLPQYGLMYHGRRPVGHTPVWAFKMTVPRLRQCQRSLPSAKGNSELGLHRRTLFPRHRH